jgi:predicted nucleic acid-binding protein
LSNYADSSLLVSLYIPNQHSRTASRLVKRHGRIWLTPLHRAEWEHAVARRLFQGDISASEAKILYEDLEHDCEFRIWVEVGLPEMAFERCIQLAKQYGTRIGMATLDTLHVASALELGAERFWTFDDRQAKLARAVGLKTT